MLIIDICPFHLSNSSLCISGAFTLVLSGIAAWDVLSTIAFDISIIARRRPWRWPMASVPVDLYGRKQMIIPFQLLYLILRIDMILYIFAYALKFNTTTKMPCQPMTFVLKSAFADSKSLLVTNHVPVSDAIGTCGSSLLLVVPRTRAVWQHDMKVTVGLGILSVGQIVLWGNCSSRYFYWHPSSIGWH